MANGAPAWMIAVPCRRSEALHDAAPRGLQLRDLSMRNKCEVASLVAAGVVSALCALVVATPPGPVLDARPLSIAVAAVPQGPAPIRIAPGVVSSASRRGLPQSSVRPELVSAYSIERADAPATARSVFPVLLVADADRETSSSRKGPGPLKRILFGSGQYRVQPFPTVSEQN